MIQLQVCDSYCRSHIYSRSTHLCLQVSWASLRSSLVCRGWWRTVMGTLDSGTHDDLECVTNSHSAVLSNGLIDHISPQQWAHWSYLPPPQQWDHWSYRPPAMDSLITSLPKNYGTPEPHTLSHPKESCTEHTRPGSVQKKMRYLSVAKN